MQNHPIKIRSVLDQTTLNPIEQTADFELKGHRDDKDKSILEGKAVVIIDPATGRALGASDFFQMTTFAHQADAAISQANPVSTTIYNVLPTTTNVRIYSINANITWATTQPTPMDIIMTIDGQTHQFRVVNPVTATDYVAVRDYSQADTNQYAPTLAASELNRMPAFLIEGRSVRIDIRVTWATTQPTPMTCRVKWARKA